MPKRPTFRELQTASAPVVMPCAHDALSARLIQRAGFRAMAISGSGALAARYGLPDLGIAGLSDVSAITRDILEATSIACMCDGDDGYGDVKSVARTVRVNEGLGVGALVLEDQSRAVKRPGQGAAIGVVSDEEIAAKLRIALDTRSNADMWIIGRTDACATQGIESALRRADMYTTCGVDGLFVSGLRKAKDLERVGKTFAGMPLTVVVYGGDGWPLLSITELHDMGYTHILYPLALLLPMCTLFDATLQSLRSAAETGGTPPSVPDEKRARSILGMAVDTERWQALESTVQALVPMVDTKVSRS